MNYLDLTTFITFLHSSTNSFISVADLIIVSTFWPGKAPRNHRSTQPSNNILNKCKINDHSKINLWYIFLNSLCAQSWTSAFKTIGSNSEKWCRHINGFKLVHGPWKIPTGKQSTSKSLIICLSLYFLSPSCTVRSESVHAVLWLGGSPEEVALRMSSGVRLRLLTEQGRFLVPARRPYQVHKTHHNGRKGEEFFYEGTPCLGLMSNTGMGNRLADSFF